MLYKFLNNKKSPVQRFFLFSNNKFQEVEISDNCSIGDAANLTNYPGIKSYSYFDVYKMDDDIAAVYFKSFTREIIGVLTKGHVSNINKHQVDRYLSDFKYDGILGAFDIENVLNTAIQHKSLSINFFCDVLNLPINQNCNKLFLMDYFNGYKYIFSNGILTDYSPIDGLSKWAKHFRDAVPLLFDEVYSYAQDFWDTNIEEINKEVNLQFNALASIPGEFNNNFTKHFYIRGTYVYNFIIENMLLNKSPISLVDFLHFTRDGVQIKEISPNFISYEYRHIVFYFDNDGNYIKSSIE